MLVVLRFRTMSLPWVSLDVRLISNGTLLGKSKVLIIKKRSLMENRNMRLGSRNTTWLILNCMMWIWKRELLLLNNQGETSLDWRTITSLMVSKWRGCEVVRIVGKKVAKWTGVLLRASTDLSCPTRLNLVLLSSTRNYVCGSYHRQTFLHSSQPFWNQRLRLLRSRLFPRWLMEPIPTFFVPQDCFLSVLMIPKGQKIKHKM